ncbi:MAG: hypothetical protein AAF205_00980 [Pseudomonadota bacterium]
MLSVFLLAAADVPAAENEIRLSSAEIAAVQVQAAGAESEDDSCDPSADPDEILVCGRGEAPRSPYRLQEREARFDPYNQETPSVSRERNDLTRLGRPGFGIGHCDGVGAGGDFGCFGVKHQQFIEQHAK